VLAAAYDDGVFEMKGAWVVAERPPPAKAAATALGCLLQHTSVGYDNIGKNFLVAAAGDPKQSKSKQERASRFGG
jgi:hypothetical protein